MTALYKSATSFKHMDPCRPTPSPLDHKAPILPEHVVASHLLEVNRDLDELAPVAFVQTPRPDETNIKQRAGQETEHRTGNFATKWITPITRFPTGREGQRPKRQGASLGGQQPNVHRDWPNGGNRDRD